MKVIVSLIEGKQRFFIINNKQFLLTTPDISKCFNISLEEYENRIINNVVRHRDVEVTFASDFSRRNVAYKENNISEEVYVERYKEEFAKELILLMLSEKEMN